MPALQPSSEGCAASRRLHATTDEHHEYHTVRCPPRGPTDDRSPFSPCQVVRLMSSAIGGAWRFSRRARLEAMPARIECAAVASNSTRVVGRVGWPTLSPVRGDSQA